MPVLAIQALGMLIVAVCYATVGLGGGTAYLALLSFGETDPGIIRPLAWGLNIIVTVVGFRNYRKMGHFSWAFSWPFLLGGGIGGALGARIPIGAEIFRWILALALLLVATRMFIQKGQRERVEIRKGAWILSLAIGVVIGVMSGVVGIGGGIVLGPVIVALGWADMKRVAALTSAYILIASSSALAAHLLGGGGLDLLRLVAFGIVCLAGGYVGSRYGAGKADPSKLQRIFSVLVFFAGVRLLLL